MWRPNWLAAEEDRPEIVQIAKECHPTPIANAQKWLRLLKKSLIL
jgi:hypothetical protein